MFLINSSLDTLGYFPKIDYIFYQKENKEPGSEISPFHVWQLTNSWRISHPIICENLQQWGTGKSGADICVCNQCINDGSQIHLKTTQKAISCYDWSSTQNTVAKIQIETSPHPPRFNKKQEVGSV